MAEIRFEHMTKKFGSVVAVRDLNLTILDKEFLTLVGPSGCVTSTTLNVLAGLEDPSEGSHPLRDRRRRYPATKLPPSAYASTTARG